MPRVTFSEFDKYPQFKGLFVGGCVDRTDKSAFTERAHAHSDPPYKGWICVDAAEPLYIGGTKKPNMLMLHELAHLLSKHGHDDVWRKRVRELGGAVYRAEQKKSRKS
jgi:hypothetical protein